MSEKPILFSTSMVQAILDDRKTQTRRVIKPQPKFPGEFVENGVYEHLFANLKEACGFIKCPYGQVGDRLWVRETWVAEKKHDKLKPADIPNGSKIWYWQGDKLTPEMGKLRPSIFMPRWASRITLEVTEVKVQRLQNISMDDAKAEGVTPSKICYHKKDGSTVFQTTYDYKSLWDKINGKKYPWISNPWVWVISFKRVK